MTTRSVCWIGLGALSVACAAGSFAGSPPVAAIAAIGATEGATTINGAVYDAKTDLPINGALLLLECDCLAEERDTQSDANGTFEFGELAPGAYTVRVLHGMADMKKAVPIQADQTIGLRFVVANDPHVRT